MFWNRKKAAPKRCGDETRDRDNSAILGRHSDSADLPPPPPPRTHSPLHVHYLKLTDGFNIVLEGEGGGETPHPPPPSTTSSITSSKTSTPTSTSSSKTTPPSTLITTTPASTVITTTPASTVITATPVSISSSKTTTITPSTITTTHMNDGSDDEETHDNNSTRPDHKATGERGTDERGTGVTKPAWGPEGHKSSGVSGVTKPAWGPEGHKSSGVTKPAWGPAPEEGGADNDDAGDDGKYHTPVSRVSSDTTELRTTPTPLTRPPISHYSPPLSRPHSSKPLPRTRKKLHPLPATRHTPTAVVYVHDRDTVKIPGRRQIEEGGDRDKDDPVTGGDSQEAVDSDDITSTWTGGGCGQAWRAEHTPHAAHNTPAWQSSHSRDATHTPARVRRVQPHLGPPRHSERPDDLSERLDQFVPKSQASDHSQKSDHWKRDDQLVINTRTAPPRADREETRLQATACSAVLTTKPPPPSGEGERGEGFHHYNTAGAGPGQERNSVVGPQSRHEESGTQIQHSESTTRPKDIEWRSQPQHKDSTEPRDIESTSQIPCNAHTTQPRHTESTAQIQAQHKEATPRPQDSDWRAQLRDIQSTAHDTTHHNNHPMNASRLLGIHDLCAASVINAVEISQRLTTTTTITHTTTTTTTTDKSIASSGGVNLGVAGSGGAGSAVFTQNRGHSVSNASDSDVNPSGVVAYRNTDTFAGTRHDNNTAGQEPPPPLHLAPTPAMENTTTTTTPHYQETDIDAEKTRTPQAVLREKNPPPPPLPPKRRPRQNTYENWTIDLLITRGVDTNSEEDDDEDDDDYENNWNTTPSPNSTLKKAGSSTGSKDSGLCVDVQGGFTVNPEQSLSLSLSEATLPGEEEEEEEERRRFSAGRISSIDELNRLHDDEDDYATLSFQQHADTITDQDDNISIASDIVFIPGARVSQSPQDQRHSMSQDHHGNHTPISSSEDEQDSPASADTSIDDADGGETTVAPPSPRDNMLKMRHLLVTGILETERYYLEYLDILIHYKRTLEASCQTSKPVISKDDIQAIFGNLQVLQEVHKEFVTGLQDKVHHWSNDQTVGDIFKWLVVMFPHFGQYAENYPSAAATIHRCCQESQQFQELAEHIVISSTLRSREKVSLEGALFKPVQRMQRNTLVIYDLIKHTPEDHADFDMLQKALSLSQHNLENFGNPVLPGQKVDERRNLVKSSFLVELVSGWRKLRFIFLFSDLLVCTKMVQHRGGKVTFDCKWFIPMNALSLVTKRGYEDDMKFSKKDDIADLKSKLRGLKTELKQETKKEESRDKHWSGISGIASSRHIEKLKKKIKELEGELILSSPKLPFKVWCDSVKPHTLLMTTDYEREEWREILTSLRRKSLRMENTPPSTFDVQEIVNSVKELPQVNKVGSLLTDTDEEAIYGTLNVTIHKLNGLRDACDTYCCVEMDSMGHFFMKARTRICSGSADPSWNEDFELELEGSQTLRILCYRKLPEKHGDILLGRGALEMSKQWLKGTFQEKTLAMNEYSLVLSVRYTAAEQTMRRTPSRHSTSVFGVKISICAKREGKTVPTIVTACAQDVEKRGLDEVGIYRVSGITSDVQKLKKHFDKNVKTGVHSLSEVPVHTATGLLKLYFRELPDPLFTEASYSNFVDALELSDAEGKEKCMLSLLHNLPDINYYTAVYLLEHLYRVSKEEKENKMTIHNLSTIFGPTLLAPAVKETGATMSEMMSIGTEQCMKQSAVIYFFLNLLVKGGSLRRSSQT